MFRTSGNVQYIGGGGGGGGRGVQYIGGYDEYIRGYHEYIGGVQYIGGYHDACREQVFKNLSISIEDPDVLNIPQCTHDIPRCAHDIPQCTHGIPPMY